MRLFDALRRRFTRCDAPEPVRGTPPVKPDVTPAGFSRAAFLARYINKQAPALTNADLAAAAERLRAPLKHIRMVRAVESAGKSFDSEGRPVILFEPHIFHRRTRGAHSPSGFSYAGWGQKPYPKSYDGRWTQMADAAAVNEAAALESASWGMFQIMGFHWQPLGYASARDFADRMADSEAEQLDALVRYIEANKLTQKLRDCSAGSPNSCRPFARAFNGPGYEKNRYHIKMAEALRGG